MSIPMDAEFHEAMARHMEFFRRLHEREMRKIEHECREPTSKPIARQRKKKAPEFSGLRLVHSRD